MDIRITRKRALVAVGITAYHIPVMAAFVTYFAVVNGKAEDFCLFGWNPKVFASWHDCVLSYDSIPGHWSHWARGIAVIFAGASVVMFLVWAVASFLAARRKILRPTAPSLASGRAHDPFRYVMPFESAAVIFIWSLGLAAVSGFLTLVSMLLFFVVATVVAIARGVLTGVLKRSSAT